MVTLARKVLGPTAVLGAFLAVTVAAVTFDALRASRALEASTSTVRTTTALAYALGDACHEEDEAVQALVHGPHVGDERQVERASERVAAVVRDLDTVALSPRAAALWGQFKASRAALAHLRDAALASARRGDPGGVADDVSRWQLMNSRSDALLKDFAVYHLRSLDRAVAELQAGRLRALGAAAVAALLGVLIAALIALGVARAVVRPIVDVAHAAERIADTGRLSHVGGDGRDDEIGTLARAFNRMTEHLLNANARLEEADRRKNEFLGMLSHELRNPLAALQNSLYILERADPGTPAAGRAREVMVRQMRHLARLVDDLLDVTRIVRGKIELRRTHVDLGELVRKCAEDHRTMISTRGLELVVEAPSAGALAVHGDETRLAQVIGNLLVNAAKFTEAGGRITLAARWDGEGAEIRVRDDGCGIDAQLLPRVFEPFTQAKQSLARPDGGLGLGLSLVKGIVELHGGTVAAHSAGPGQGAEFVLRLPVTGTRRETTATAPGTPA